MTIVATINCLREEDIKYVSCLNKQGVSIFRINRAKYSCENDVENDIKSIKNLNKENKILLDIPFPGKKSRLHINGSVEIKKGETRKLVCGTQAADEDTICISDIMEDLKIGEQLWYNTGEGSFRVIGNTNGYNIMAENTFNMYDKKALVSKKIRKSNNNYLEEIIKLRPDYVAFSFVEYAEDLMKIYSSLKSMDICVIAKIETRFGIENINSIVDYCDSIMLGRGDLALNVECQEFMPLLKEAITNVHKRNKPCFIATGVGESLSINPIPSRAELSDFDMIKTMEVEGIVLSRKVSMNENIVETLNTIRKLL